jgi:mediator of RNA polymerase II transcription subunit 22
MSSQTAILSKFDNNIQLILTKFNEIQQLLILNGKDIEVQAVEATQIQADTQIIVRLVEELLTLTKGLKEKWILGQIHNTSADILQGNNYHLYEKLNSLLSNITDK